MSNTYWIWLCEFIYGFPIISHNTVMLLSKLARKWVNASVVNRLSNMLFYCEMWPDVPPDLTYPLSFQLQVNWETICQIPHISSPCNLLYTSTAYKLSTLHVTSEENGHHVKMAYSSQCGLIKKRKKKENYSPYKSTMPTVGIELLTMN